VGTGKRRSCTATQTATGSRAFACGDRVARLMKFARHEIGTIVLHVVMSGRKNRACGGKDMLRKAIERAKEFHREAVRNNGEPEAMKTSQPLLPQDWWRNECEIRRALRLVFRLSASLSAGRRRPGKTGWES